MNSRVVDVGPVAVLTLALLAWGCGQSHEAAPIAGVPSDVRVVDLSDAQWADLCHWVEALRAGAPLTYGCQGGAYVGPDCPESVCWLYDWTYERCYSWAPGRPTWGERDWWHSVDRSCGTTVAEWATCWSARAADACYAASAIGAECEAYFSCWTRPSDAGVHPDAR